MPVLLFYYLFILSSISKNFFCFTHVRNGVNGEGAAFGAGAAGNAVAGVGFKRRIMLAYGFRHFALRFGKVQKLGYVCHINAFGARRAMSAVHAVPFPADFGEACKNFCIVFFGFACFFVIKRT